MHWISQKDLKMQGNQTIWRRTQITDLLKSKNTKNRLMMKQFQAVFEIAMHNPSLRKKRSEHLIPII
ncbi:hypothetical protein P872_09565 [Rhodonellum psychrophilum GCM71 = DSM 17998]|uniref:Uncharacterized protein n=2 Tax=Rhodonellum TaxID=336827 RepID=U5BU17_9BACT|nr:hypothetical protein P872_09565 [Rhodonellum psychrophilum GCM71 = DSM 17998]SDZ40343.1 hypothetical protein SAMN05444412_11322 [Rhodonellum ikkaensis]